MARASIHETVAGKIREIIAKHGSLKKSELTRRLSHIAGKEKRDAAIKWMVKQGELVIEKIGGAGSGLRGRPGERICAA